MSTRELERAEDARPSRPITLRRSVRVGEIEATGTVVLEFRMRLSETIDVCHAWRPIAPKERVNIRTIFKAWVLSGVVPLGSIITHAGEEAGTDRVPDFRGDAFFSSRVKL